MTVQRWNPCHLGIAVLRIVLAYAASTLAVGFAPTLAQVAGRHAIPGEPREVCPLGAQGSVVHDPVSLRSRNGVLKVNLALRNTLDANGSMRYCYVDDHGNQAPTLRLHTGDTLILRLRNEIALSPSASAKRQAHTELRAQVSRAHPKQNPCAGGVMTAATTNLHFHGMMIPPVCHQDETLKTMIRPGDPPFEYRIKISRSQAPGLYWYHPHPHGFSEEQVLGGASGALIIEGTEQVNHQVAGLPERLLVIRDQKMPDPSPSEKPDPNRPTKQLTINSIPVPYPLYPLTVIKMKALERQFWRVLNASADTYLDIAVIFSGKPQSLGIVSLDGVPLRYDLENSQDYLLSQSHISLPPGGRVEFVLNGPPEGVQGLLVTRNVFRGAAEDDGTQLPVDKSASASGRVGQDDIDPPRPLATIFATADPPGSHSVVPASSAAVEKPSLPPLSTVRPVRTRTLYFSEKLSNPNDPKSPTLFFITEEGHVRALFDPNAALPDIVVHQGDVEDWFIENRSLESHTFHIHQIHFLLVGLQGVAYEEPALRDTMNLPAWDGFSRYPRVRLRMDFRDPDILGTIPFHCHIMQHVDGGMMGTVRVEPAPATNPASSFFRGSGAQSLDKAKFPATSASAPEQK